MPDDAEKTTIGHDLVGHSDRSIWVALVVEVDHLEFVAIKSIGSVEALGCPLRSCKVLLAAAWSWRLGRVADHREVHHWPLIAGEQPPGRQDHRNGCQAGRPPPKLTPMSSRSGVITKTLHKLWGWWVGEISQLSWWACGRIFELADRKFGCASGTVLLRLLQTKKVVRRDRPPPPQTTAKRVHSHRRPQEPLLAATGHPSIHSHWRLESHFAS